ncbi:MAG: sn-glycerol-3-phosphate ABC transporter ATP-binding protein UgpC [Verrucomicrobia bacterium]|nr:sn-glycerol-3-phosphate ABC transporter ATP-binding protein UgpC [Verrucomicrobiota bacterium]
MATIEFHQVNKSFADGTHAVRDFNLAINDGEFMVLVGPSGCGKSTILRMLAGLEETTSGEIRIGDRIVNDLPPQQRDIAMVFQNYALYPHKTVRKNLEFPLQMAGWAKDRINAGVTKVARLLELESLLERKPGQLSGGQRQRVAMGRALGREPAVFLMDEPLSNLDAQLRVQMRREITALQKRLRTTTLYVTHDQVEAMTMGDRLAVLHHGQLQQAGTPKELYECPANVFVATFLGSPRMNLFENASATTANGAPGFRFGNEVLPLPEAVTKRFSPSGLSQIGKLIIGLRPEAFRAPEQDASGQRLQVRVVAVEAMGHEQIVYFDAGVKPLTATAKAAESGEVPLSNAAFAARLPSRCRAVPGAAMELALDVSQAHVFNEKGNALGGISGSPD